MVGIAPRSGGVGKAFTAAEAVTKSISLGTAIAIPLVIVFAVIVAFIMFTVCKRRREKKKNKEEDEAHDPLTANHNDNSKAEANRHAISGWDSDEEADLKASRTKMYEVPLGQPPLGQTQKF
ncbi:hypothetical protein B0T16DRAFT_457220 [Cercophora newfieldiana]|uniref:Uncharacterized protein n=1 Tax=Cercophora newfieldiana TaxID=92897 RepID=A0AA39YC64_9PEZI|nr:hypothetical protein B0T16DRAFT_457220 [Cercophora newfieldiana]